MNFSWALNELKGGKLLTRTGWNGKKIYVYHVSGTTFKANRGPLSKILGIGTEVTYLPHIDMRTATGECVPWVMSQTDLLSNDWIHYQ